MKIEGTFPKVTRSTTGIVYQAPLGRAIDAGIDGHGTIIPGNLPEWSKIPEVAAKLAEFGITGEIGSRPRGDGWSDGGEAFEHMRSHEGQSGKSMVREFWTLVKNLGLAGVDGDGSTPTPAPSAPTSFKAEVEAALRRAGTEFHEAIMQARRDGVATEEQETEFLKRRLALLVALDKQVKALPDNVNPGEPIAPNGEGQAECDALWSYINSIRRDFARQRMTGYTVDSYWAAKGDSSYFRSLIDTRLYNGLNSMSNVALVLGLRGRWTTVTVFGVPRLARTAYYIDPFQSWASQDEVMREFAGLPGGGGGIHGGGQ